MSLIDRATPLITLIDAATGPVTGVVVPVGSNIAAVIEVLGPYTNLEAVFEVSIDEGITYWPVALEMLSTGTSGPKMTTPGLYALMEGFRAVSHMRVSVTSAGPPTGSMTIKAVGIMY
jgi:hypothetical protein